MHVFRQKMQSLKKKGNRVGKHRFQKWGKNPQGCGCLPSQSLYDQLLTHNLRIGGLKPPDLNKYGFKLAVSGEMVYVGKRDGKLFQSLDSEDS